MLSYDVGILLVRVLFGLAMAAHGTQKLFGWFGGYGLKKTGAYFEGLGFRPGVPFAAAAGLSEMAGGLLLALGLLTPFGTAAVLAAMLVAMVSVHVRNGFFAMNNGIELPFLYAVAAVGLALTGPGAFSLDAVLGLTATVQGFTGVLIMLGIVGAAAALVLRRPAHDQVSTAHS